jgi:hypothetical protein
MAQMVYFCKLMIAAIKIYCNFNPITNIFPEFDKT